MDLNAYTVRAPTWGEWQAAVDAGLGAGGTVDAAVLLESYLLPCVSVAGRPLGLFELQALPPSVADELLAAALSAMEQERAALGLTAVPEGDGLLLACSLPSLRLRLRRWTFGERNRALSAAMKVLADGRPVVDVSAYERTTVSQCVTVLDADGTVQSVSPDAAARWPVALGEATVQALERLNGLAPEREAVLRACVEHGMEHPDLTLLHLCRTFGWTPAVVDALPAEQVERLLSALRVLSAPGVAPVPSTADAGGEVTRIVVPLA
jgi:hypothetical protein